MEGRPNQSIKKRGSHYQEEFSLGKADPNQYSKKGFTFLGIIQSVDGRKKS